MNRVEISGGLVRDPELAFTAGGAARCEFTVAVNEARWSSKEQAQVVDTTYVSCQAWFWLAEDIAEREYQKGDEVLVVGRLSQRTIEKKDGTKEQKTRVEVVTVTLVKSRRPVRSEEPSYAPGEEPF